MFGSINRYECSSLGFTLGRYAQHENALHVNFVQRGKRKLRGLVITPGQYALILAGHGHFEPDSMLVPLDYNERTGVSTSMSRYSSADPRWANDFRASYYLYREENPDVAELFEYIERR